MSSEILPRLLGLGSSIFSMLAVLIIMILLIIAHWKIFVKAGEAGWKSIIPIYNSMIDFKIASISPWFLILYSAIPLAFSLASYVKIIQIIVWVASIIFNIWIIDKTRRNFGKSAWFGVGMFFLPIIFIPILGFGSSTFVGNEYENNYDSSAKILSTTIIILACLIIYSIPIFMTIYISSDNNSIFNKSKEALDYYNGIEDEEKDILNSYNDNYNNNYYRNNSDYNSNYNDDEFSSSDSEDDEYSSDDSEDNEYSSDDSEDSYDEYGSSDSESSSDSPDDSDYDSKSSYSFDSDYETDEDL